MKQTSLILLLLIFMSTTHNITYDNTTFDGGIGPIRPSPSITVEPTEPGPDTNVTISGWYWDPGPVNISIIYENVDGNNYLVKLVANAT